MGIACVTLMLLWLSHGRRLAANGSVLNRYSGVAPAQLFEAYGAPGSWQRCTCIVLELMLLWFAWERLCGVVGFLNVGALSLEQRRRALIFTRGHQPSICQKGPE